MSTTKPRINISASKQTRAILAQIAKRDHVPLATKAAQLIEMALEIEEDIAFAAIVEQRMKIKSKHIPHHLAWK